MPKDMKVALVTDSSCDLPADIVEKYNLYIIPVRVITSKGEFKDRVTITSEQLYEVMKEEIPKTSLPLPEDIYQLYSHLKSEGYSHILHYSISSKLSGTYNISYLVAQEFQEENPGFTINVIDSLTLSTGLGMLVIEAAKDLENGKSIEEVIARTEKLRKGQLGSFVVKTLEYLRKGGRIGLVEGVVGSLLKIRPVIYVNSDGVYETIAKARGYTNAMETMMGEFVRKFSNKKVHLSVVHGAAPVEANQVLERMKKSLNVVDSFISSVSPALAVHTGPGLVGIIAHEA